jgi:threonine dehydratase
MRRVRDTEHWLIEGAAGVAVAAFVKEAPRYVGKRVVVVVCGRNISEAVLKRALT